MGEIKKGYKQTEFGLIPEDWELCSFKDVLSTFSSGATPYRGIPEYYKGEIRWISSGELNYNTINETIEHISEIAVKNTNLKTHSPGTFLMAVTGLEAEGTRGRCAIVGLPSTTNQSCLAINSTVRMTTEFLFWFYRQWSEYLAFKYCQGTKQQSYTAALVKELPICCPKETTEQAAIATALSNVDALIASLDKKITKKQQIKQGAMKQLLTVEKRLPGFCGEWVEKSLCEILDYEQPTKYIVKSTEYIGNGIPVLTAGKSFILGYTDENENVFVKTPVIIFDDFTTATKYVGFHFKVKSSAMKILKLKNEDYDIRLIFEIMQLIIFPLSGHQRYWISEYRNILIKVPNTYEEQIAIAQIITDMDNEIVQLETDLNKYKQLKGGMMQQLLTGKIRLTGSVQTTIATEQTKIVELNSKKQSHTDQINEAVVISFLVNKFSSVQYPLSRFRYTKYTYLLHRQYEHVACGFKKHAAGPYKPENRYKGPENIAIKNKYISKVLNSKSKKDAFLINDDVDKALVYFNEWFGTEIQQWIEQFRYYKNDDLEVLTTVDESIFDLKIKGETITVNSIKQYIDSIPQWKDKLKKDCFSDINIQKMINKSIELFS